MITKIESLTFSYMITEKWYQNARCIHMFSPCFHYVKDMSQKWGCRVFLISWYCFHISIYFIWDSKYPLSNGGATIIRPKPLVLYNIWFLLETIVFTCGVWPGNMSLRLFALPEVTSARRTVTWISYTLSLLPGTIIRRARTSSTPPSSPAPGIRMSI